MATIQASAIPDIVATTRVSEGRLRFQQIAQNLGVVAALDENIHPFFIFQPGLKVENVDHETGCSPAQGVFIPLQLFYHALGIEEITEKQKEKDRCEHHQRPETQARGQSENRAVPDQTLPRFFYRHVIILTASW